jgi:hypothetical protein
VVNGLNACIVRSGFWLEALNTVSSPEASCADWLNRLSTITRTKISLRRVSPTGRYQLSERSV